MPPSAAQVERIREIVEATLAELGMADVNWSLVTETILFRDRTCDGRSFGTGGVRAVWLANQNTVTFYNDDGELLTTVELGQPNRGGKNAA